jgi:hypothetical protein
MAIFGPGLWQSGQNGSIVLQSNLKTFSMTVLDLAKATLVCGGLAFLIYNFPVLGQIVLIGFLSILWLLYARKTLRTMRRR